MDPGEIVSRARTGFAVYEVIMRLLRVHPSLLSRLLLLGLLSALPLLSGACGGHTFSGQMSFFNIPAPFLSTGNIVTGSDGNIWFTTVAYDHFGTNQPSGTIGRITSDGKLSMFPLPHPNSYPQNIVAGPDGNLWFTLVQGSGKVEYGTDTPPGFQHTVSEIGYLTITGKFTFLNPLPSGTYAGEVVSGPDNHIWFTEVIDSGPGGSDVATALVRVTSSASGGALSTFSLPLLQQSDIVTSLVTGPDGNLWFGISGVLMPGYAEFGKIGRMTPQGALQIFPLGKFIEDRNLAAGPDKNLWFTSRSGVGRVTLDGKLHLFTPPDLKARYNYNAGGIVASPDGGLWYVGGSAGINRVSTDGTFTSYSIPASANADETYRRRLVRGITIASDGTLWVIAVDEIEHMV